MSARSQNVSRETRNQRRLVQNGAERCRTVQDGGGSARPSMWRPSRALPRRAPGPSPPRRLAAVAGPAAADGAVTHATRTRHDARKAHGMGILARPADTRSAGQRRGLARCFTGNKYSWREYSKNRWESAADTFRNASTIAAARLLPVCYLGATELSVSLVCSRAWRCGAPDY